MRYDAHFVEVVQWATAPPSTRSTSPPASHSRTHAARSAVQPTHGRLGARWRAGSAMVMEVSMDNLFHMLFHALPLREDLEAVKAQPQPEYTPRAPAPNRDLAETGELRRFTLAQVRPALVEGSGPFSFRAPVEAERPRSNARTVVPPAAARPDLLPRYPRAPAMLPGCTRPEGLADRVQARRSPHHRTP